MELENIILSEVNQAQKTKNRMFSLICGLWSHDEARAHKGDMRIGKNPPPKKKIAFDVLNAKELIQKL
jgi:hypothetical protein